MSNVATIPTVTPSTQNPKQTQPRQTAKEMIAANVQSLIKQLEAGHSDALTAYLNAMSRFHSYSFGNVLEIARQRPTATRVAGMYAWNQLGRRVKRGEKGIRILAPIIGIKRKPDAEAEKDITKQNTRVLVGFRNAYVFDRLSRDLRPARVRPVSHTTPVYHAVAAVALPNYSMLCAGLVDYSICFGCSVLKRSIPRKPGMTAIIRESATPRAMAP